MTTLTKANKVKSSFTIRPDLYKRLKSIKNSSSVVNEALAIYFEKNDYLKQAEEEYWNEKIKAGLKDIENWDTYKLNPNWEIIDSQLLNEKLWA